MKTKEGLWKLSPSGLYTYEECPACFWIENHIGKHPSLPYTLNSAMDVKLKERYDYYRLHSEMPPEISHLQGLRLFGDLETLNRWRSSPTSLRYINERDGYILNGKLDEVLVNEKNELIPADYKTAAKEPGIDKQKYYRLQLNAYGLMLQNLGHQTAKVSYLLHYFAKNKDDKKPLMEFDTQVDEVLVNIPSFQKKITEMAEVLNGDFPGVNEFCQKCLWAEKRKSY